MNFWGLKYQEKRIEHSLKSVRGGVQIFGKCIIICPENIEVGSGLKLNEGVYIHAGRGSILIGNDVTLSPYAKLIVGGYDLKEFFENGNRIHYTDGVIEIGNHVWIGAGATILSPAKIKGENVVVAAGAVVKHEFYESNIVLAGVPAKIVKYYKPEDYKNNSLLSQGHLCRVISEKKM